MEQNNLLIIAMAERCLRTIQNKPDDARFALPDPLRPRHLRWMCEMLIEHAEVWPISRAHRWVGFIQAGMIANYFLTLDSAKSMFAEIHEEFGGIAEDGDLLDHFNPKTDFELELGGQG